MADHGARDHAEWSASASDRRWACPGSLALEAGLPDREGSAAAWGTACHQVCDKALKQNRDAIDFLDTVEKTKAHVFEVDEEMVECAQTFIDYVRQRAEDGEMLVEQKFSLDSLDPPFEAGGTGDVVILHPAESLIEVVDLKTGMKIVEAPGSRQLRTYGLGAVLANKGKWRRVKTTIVQPRAAHRDGPIRSDELDIVDLFDWTVDLRLAMQDAADAVFDAKRLSQSEWAARHLSAGDHCTFCKAAPTCPALQAKSLEVAQTFFHTDGAAQKPPAPETLDMAQIVRVLDAADMVTGWLNAVRAYAQEQAERGYPVTDGEHEYVLTPKQARRKWNVEGDDPVAIALSDLTGELPDDFFTRKIMSPAQAEKFLGKKRAKEIEHLWVKESSGFNLTRSDKTTRPAVDAPYKQFFQIEKE